MIDNISLKIAQSIKRQSEEINVSVEVMRYSLNVIFNTVFIIVLSVILGWATGNLLNTIIAMFAFSFLRQFSGGVHIRKSEVCIVVSTLLIVTIGHVSKYITSEWTFYFTILALATTLICAPSKIEGQTRIPKKHYPLLKVLSGVIVSVNFFIGSPVLAISFFAQSITLIRLKGGEK